MFAKFKELADKKKHVVRRGPGGHRDRGHPAHRRTSSSSTTCTSRPARPSCPWRACG
ncbi:MAG: hypothetical protein MZV70_10600 [Desulfobacterales bacterium]|nr:hypothetical protein [Desulfobacterales bacterium]